MQMDADASTLSNAENQHTSLEQALQQPFPGGQAPGMMRRHAPQQGLHCATALDRLWLLRLQRRHLRLNQLPLCRETDGQEAGSAGQSASAHTGVCIMFYAACAM